jgi:hypothetical protein
VKGVLDDVDDLREQAETIRRDTNRRVEDVRQNMQLTSEARRAQMAREIATSNEKLGALERQYNDRVIQEGRSLERKLWVNPKADADPTGAAWRTAHDRADSIDNFEQASALLERAERSGDDLLAKAIAHRAVGTRWHQLADRYGQDHPEVASAISALGDFRHETGSNWRVASSMRFSKIQPPRELSGCQRPAWPV